MRDGWTETTLGEVSLINPEVTSSFKNTDEIIYIDLSSVSAENGIDTELFRGTYGEAPGRARRVVRAQDVLVSTVRPYLRGFALVPEFLDGEVASTGFAVLRAKPTRALPGLIWAIVGTDEFVDFLMERATGSSYPAVRSSDVSAYPFRLPPIEEQRRIVDVVASVDAYIDALQQQVDAARAARNAVLHELLTAGGDDWTETTLGEVAQWSSGGTPQSGESKYYDGDIPWCVIGDLTEGEVFVTEKQITQEGLQNSSAKIVQPGAVMIAMYGASIGRTGLVAVPMATNQAIACALPNVELLDNLFLLIYLQTQKTLFVEAGQGAAQPNISQTVLKRWPIPLPSIAEQKRIVEIVSSMDDVIQAAERAVVEAKNLRSGLLSDLLSGEHEIPVSYDQLLGAA